MRNIASVFFLFILVLNACTIQQKKHISKTDAKKQSNKKEYDLFFDAEIERLANHNVEARKMYQHFVSLYPNNATAWFNLARLDLESYDFDGAENHLLKAINLSPKNIYYLELYSNVLAYNKKYNDALKQYQLLEKNNPQNATDYIYRQFDLHNRLAQYSLALEALDRVEKLLGFDYDISMEKISLLKKLKQYDQVIEEFEKMKREEPYNYKTDALLADFYNMRGDKQKAKTTIETLLLSAPNEPVVIWSALNFYNRNDDDSLYKKTLSDVIYNPNFDSEFKLGYLMPNIMNKADAKFSLDTLENFLQHISNQEPKNSHVLEILADQYYSNKKYDSAARQYKKLLMLDSSTSRVWQNLLFSYSNLDKKDSLILGANYAIKKFPKDAIFPYLRGVTFLEEKKYEKAVDDLQAAVRLSENNDFTAQLYAYLGDAYNGLKNYSESDAHYDKSLNLQEDATTLNNYAYYLSLRNTRLEDAQKMSGRSLELAPDVKTFLDTYGWILYKRGNYIEAKKYITKALNDDFSGDADVLEHLGDVYFKLNDVDNAKYFWQKAKEMNGGSQYLDKKITEGTLYED